MLEIKNLKKTFQGGVEALRGVDLKVNKGEFLSILGPSGSGKTTLLRSINGLENIDSGEIFFESEKINKIYLPEVQKKTGMIFQEFNLVNNLSAINNVLTGLLNSSSKFLSMFYLFKKEQKLQALKALETVGLLDKAYNRADELSGGQRQRVGIARAIAIKPEYVLYDEPTTGLDPITSDKINSLIKKVSEKRKVTSIVVTHNMKTLKIVANKVIMLHEGDIIFDGETDELFSSNDSFIRYFVTGRKK